MYFEYSIANHDTIHPATSFYHKTHAHAQNAKMYFEFRHAIPDIIPSYILMLSQNEKITRFLRIFHKKINPLYFLGERGQTIVCVKNEGSGSNLSGLCHWHCKIPSEIRQCFVFPDCAFEEVFYSIGYVKFGTSLG